MISAGFFDLDLTLIDSQEKLYPGLESILDRKHRNFTLVILTGRGYPRYIEAIEKNSVLKNNVPYIALEHGARIVTDKGETIQYVSLTNENISMIIEYIQTHSLNSVSFYPKDMNKPTVIWSGLPLEQLGLSSAYTTGVRYIEKLTELFQAFEYEKPCTITVRAPKGTKPVLPKGISFYTRGQNINFVPKCIDKGKATTFIAEREKISLSQAMGAGNDVNDLPLLTLSELGVPIFVGNDIHGINNHVLPKNTIYVPDPAKLANILKKIIPHEKIK